MNDKIEEVYLELKRIMFAYESKKEIGASKAYEHIMFLICESFDIYEEYAEIIKEQYILRILEGCIADFETFTFYELFQNAPEQLNKEIIDFVECFSEYVYENKNMWSRFEFQRKRKPNIIIEFVKKDSLFPKDNSHSSVYGRNSNELSICNMLVEQDGILFDIPVNMKGEIDVTRYASLLVDSGKLIEGMLKNFREAQNSFYGIEKNRYLIHEVCFKYNNDTLYMDDELTMIGSALIENIKSALKANEDVLNDYQQYYDKSYLFVTLGTSLYRFDIF